MNQELARRSTTEQGGKYLVFALDPNQYAVPIQSVREIIAMHDITPLPRMPHCVRGVINLRGRIIPIADLRRSLGMSERDATSISCIIVTETEPDDDGAVTPIGCIVDSVCEVREIARDDIQLPPQGSEGGYVDGLVRTDETVVALLQLDSLFAAVGIGAQHLG